MLITAMGWIIVTILGVTFLCLGAMLITVLRRISRNLAGIHAIQFVKLTSPQQKNAATEMLASMKAGKI